MAMLNYQRVNSASKTSIFHNQTLGKKRLRSSDGFFCYTWNVVRRDLSTRQCLTLECRRCSELAYVFTPFGWFLLVTFMIFCLNRNVWSLNTNFRSLNILFHRSITILLASKFHHHFFSCWIFIYIYICSYIIMVKSYLFPSQHPQNAVYSYLLFFDFINLLYIRDMTRMVLVRPQETWQMAAKTVLLLWGFQGISG